MDMGHSTAMKVEESNAEEISNLFNMNTAFLWNALSLLTKNSSLNKSILLFFSAPSFYLCQSPKEDLWKDSKEQFLKCIDMNCKIKNLIAV